jgi:hypothetical protein
MNRMFNNPNVYFPHNFFFWNAMSEPTWQAIGTPKSSALAKGQMNFICMPLDLNPCPFRSQGPIMSYIIEPPQEFY